MLLCGIEHLDHHRVRSGIVCCCVALNIDHHSKHFVKVKCKLDCIFELCANV
jgi:hypothetical protein